MFSKSTSLETAITKQSLSDTTLAQKFNYEEGRKSNLLPRAQYIESH